MNSGRAARKRNIGSVVNNQRNLIPVRKLFDLKRLFEIFPSSDILFPQLHKRYAALKALFHHPKKGLLRTAAGTVRHQI